MAAGEVRRHIAHEGRGGNRDQNAEQDLVEDAAKFWVVEQRQPRRPTAIALHGATCQRTGGPY